MSFAARRHGEPPWPEPPARAALRALVVDDSELARQFLARELAALEVASEGAASSQDALALMAGQPFDLVLLDIDLGDDSAVDGLALCRQIKRGGALPPGAPVPPVIVVSVHAGEMDRVRGMLAGCDALIGKPPAPGALRRALAAHGLATDDTPRRPAPRV